ncbi:hypothetical protein GCM10009693_23690 [Leucobacter chromiireducens subsp. chromiireducens]
MERGPETISRVREWGVYGRGPEPRIDANDEQSQRGIAGPIREHVIERARLVGCSWGVAGEAGEFLAARPRSAEG